LFGDKESTDESQASNEESHATRLTSWVQEHFNEQTYVNFKNSLGYDDVPYDVYVNHTASDSTDLVSPDHLREERERWGFLIPYLAMFTDGWFTAMAPLFAIFGFYRAPRTELTYWLVNFAIIWGLLQLIPE
jgi:hypothetical protein